MSPSVQENGSTKLDILRRLLGDESLYFRKCLKILTKKSTLMPFELNVPQVEVQKILNKQEAETGRIRAIILKARQEGVSTYVQGKFFKAASTKRYRRALVVSHELDSAEHIFGMSKLFLQELPTEMVPMVRRSNRREILFENPQFDARRGGSPGLRSYIRVDTAKDVDVGASMTVNMLHLSEVARWPNATATLTSLLQAVPDESGTSVIFESTAQGVGGEFWKRYWDAKSGKSEYIAVFLPWFLNPEYSMLLGWNEKMELIDEEEERLVRDYHLTMEQIKWRRHTLANKCGGDLLMFQQEYPSSDEEAFLTSGFRKYPLEWILNAERHVLPPEMIGNLVEDEKIVRFEWDKRGQFQVWDEPQPGRQYIVSGDVGEGVSEADFSVATVWDHSSWEQVGMWRGRITPEEFGYVLYTIGRYYNGAMVACESNGIGLASCVILRNIGYPNIYYSRKRDEKTMEKTRKIGFLTTSRTRGIGIGLLGKALKDEDITIRAKEITSELRTFVSKEGKVEAEEGCHDDCVISSMIFVSVATELPAPDFERERSIALRLPTYRGGLHNGIFRMA